MYIELWRIVSHSFVKYLAAFTTCGLTITSLERTVLSKEHRSGNPTVKHRRDKALDLHVHVVYDAIIYCRQFQGSKIDLVYR